MAIFDLFSKREEESQQNDVFSYDEIPHPLRVQILNALNDAAQRIYSRTIPAYRIIGTEGKDIFADSCLQLRREYGLAHLPVDTPRSHRESQETLAHEFTAFFQNCESIQVLDALDVIFQMIEMAERKGILDSECNSQTITAEINRRFMEHSVGFQCQSGRMMQISNEWLHVDAVVPTLKVLGDPLFSGAESEFLNAHDHFRHQRNQECLNECLKAFESAMKIICDNKGWSYKQNDTSKRLIQICLDKGLVPTFSQQQLTSLRTLLESGIPTARNKRAGHGQGVQVNHVSNALARYVLHITAATILLLVESASQ